jgi:hypothetical protein
VETFGNVMSEYAFHAESKCTDVQGKVPDKNTRGLPQRRHVRIDQFRFIGKESNALKEVDAGLIHSDKETYTEYIDPSHDEWELKIRPVLRKVSLSTLSRESGLSRRMLVNARTGKTRTNPRNQGMLVQTLRRMGNKLETSRAFENTLNRCDFGSFKS